MKYLLLFLLIVSCCLNAEEQGETSSLSPYEGDISGVVNGVCVISGSYNFSEVDYVIPGTSPVEYRRIYNGPYVKDLDGDQSWSKSEELQSQMHRQRWKTNYFSKIVINHQQLTFDMPSKGLISFFGEIKRSKSKTEKQDFKFRVKPENLGYTNASSGSPLDNVHFKNTSILRKNISEEALHFDFADGTHYSYRSHSKNSCYYPVHIAHPIGATSKFFYSNYNGKLQSYEMWNKNGTTRFGGIYFNPHCNYVDKPSNKVAFTDGKEVIFEYYSFLFPRAKTGDLFDSWRCYLKNVNRPDKPKVEFEYDRPVIGICALSKIIRPDGRFQQIDYQYKINSYLDVKVKELKAPTSFDGTAVGTHKFTYSRHKDHHVTSVCDANDHLTKYFSQSSRLSKIERYLGANKKQYKLYSMEDLKWDDEGKILARVFKDANKKIQYAKKYQYDLVGNLNEEVYFGNLSGKGTVISLDKNGVPIDDQAEKWVKYYNHDNSKFHRLIVEREKYKTTFYDYVPDTTLVASKITKYNGSGIYENFVTREFYAYDENATLIETISDDGTSDSKEDLTGVTQRLISRVLPRTQGHGIGLPLDQRNFYLDIDTGEEKLISHHVNTYNDDYRLVSREYYDSDDSYLYTLTWEYDRYGNMTAETDPLGYKTFRRYDENCNVVWEQSPSGILTKEHSYDFCNRLIRTDIKGADGTMMSTTNTYDTMGRLLAKQNHRGEETTYTYDELDRVIAIHYPAVADAKGILQSPVETFTYDVMGRKTSCTDGRGFTTQKEYNAYGSVTKIVYPDGTEENSLYNFDNTCKEHRARNGAITKCEYDPLNRPVLVQMFDEEGHLLSTTKNTYNTLHLLSTTLPNGTVVSYQYDGAGRVIAESTEDKLVTYEYDTLSRRCATLHHIDGDARVSRVLYDLIGQVVEERTENLAGDIFTKITHLYDAEGKKIRSYTYGDNGASCTSMEYDPYGRVTCINDNEGHSIITTYDEQCVDEKGFKGLLMTQIDPLGLRTLSFQNAMGKIVKVEKQGITGETLSLSNRLYDLSGNLIEERHTVINPGKANRLVINTWECDSFGKPLVQVEAYKSEEQKTTYYAYDVSGQLAATTLPNGIIISQTYDALGRLTERYSSNGDLKQYFSYDIAGNPTLIKSLEGTIERRYDALNRMTEEKLIHGETIGYTYDVFDRITQLTLPDRSTIEYFYDPFHLKAVVRGSKTHTYDAYDLHGNLIAATLMTGEQATYSYNSLGRLESIVTPRWSEKEITYDPVGNITHFTIDDIPNDYAYDELYQLKEERGAVDHIYQHDSLNNRTCKDGSNYTLNALNQVISDGYQDYTYDVNGNLTQGDGFNYTYDSLGRLTLITDGEEVSYNYTYDPFNRRISSNDIHFLYQGEMEIGAIRNGKIVELRVLGKGRGAEGGAAVLIEIDGKSYTPLHDHRGHCAALLSDERVVEKYCSSAFGEEEESQYINPWRFSSKRHDPTGLVNFGRRYYHPKLGRWMTPDPKGFSAGPNLYAYCVNNPLIKFDLYGLDWFRSDSQQRQEDKQESREGRGWWQSFKDTIRDTIGYVREKVGRSIEFVCHHALPLREGYNVGSMLGRAIAGNGFQRFSAEYSPARHEVFNEGGCRPGERPMIYMKGMLNIFSSSLQSLNDLKELFDGREIHYFYSPSEGFVCDVMKAIMMKCGFETTEGRMALDFIHSEFQQDPNHPGFDIYAQSRSTFIASYLQDKIDPEYRPKVNIKALGGKILVPDGFGPVNSYTAYLDPIPPVCDFFNYCVAMITKPSYVNFSRSEHWWVHDFDDPKKPYQQVYIEDAKSFIQKRGIPQ